MSEEKGYLDTVLRDKESGVAVKAKRIAFSSVIEALLELQSIALDYGDKEEKKMIPIGGSAKFIIETTIRDKNGNIKDHGVEEGIGKEEKRK